MPDMNEPNANTECQVGDWKARATLARREAATLNTRAEIWEECAMRLQDAIDKDKRNAQGKETAR